MSSSEIRKFMKLMEAAEGAFYYQQEGSGGQQLFSRRPFGATPEFTIRVTELTKPEAALLAKFFAQDPEGVDSYDTSDEAQVNDLAQLVAVDVPFYGEWLNDKAAEEEGIGFDEWLEERDAYEEWEGFYHSFLNKYYPHFKLFALSGD